MKPVQPFDKRLQQRGFTLIEVSAALGVALALSTALIALLQQHISFVAFFQRQTFLVAEAPNIGDLVVRIMNRADHFFVYATRDEALAGGQPVLGTGQAVGLFFKGAAEDTQLRVLAIEPLPDGGSALRCYAPVSGGAPTSWAVSTRIASGEFRAANGILGATLNGPNGEQVTYWGGAR
jgi:prepilin-type N-terminal cleavage/methylation domain-containing protein